MTNNTTTAVEETEAASTDGAASRLQRLRELGEELSSYAGYFLYSYDANGEHVLTDDYLYALEQTKESNVCLSSDKSLNAVQDVYAPDAIGKHDCEDIADECINGSNPFESMSFPSDLRLEGDWDGALDAILHELIDLCMQLIHG